MLRHGRFVARSGGVFSAEEFPQYQEIHFVSMVADGQTDGVPLSVGDHCHTQCRWSKDKLVSAEKEKTAYQLREQRKPPAAITLSLVVGSVTTPSTNGVSKRRWHLRGVRRYVFRATRSQVSAGSSSPSHIGA